MAIAKLELTSGHGDLTLSGVRFVLHGTANLTDSVSTRDAGLEFVEGQPVVTTNLAHAAGWAVGIGKSGRAEVVNEQRQPGSIFVAAMPPNFHLGYAVFTTAYVDRQLKRVSGAPLRYASARNQLAFYMSPDTEKERVHIESEVANGYPLAQHPHLLLETQYLVGGFEPGPDFQSLMRQLEGTVANLQLLDIDALERSLVDLFVPSVPEHAVLAPTAMRELVIRTAESLVLTRLRMMRWQGLAMLGYRFFEGREQVEVPAAGSAAEQRQRMEELGRLLASSQLFMAELSWLKTYAIHELELMKMELDGALLEDEPDSQW